MRTRPLSPSPVLDHPTARPRVLFVAEAVSLAHVGRPALLARWASAAGYDVHFACGPTYTDLVRGEGLSPVPLATIAPRTFYDRLARGEFFYTAAELTEYVRAELDLLRGTRPDLVVGDFRLSMSISAALLGVPLVTLSNAYWSPAAASRFPPPRAGWFRLLPRPVRKLAFACVRPLAFRCFGRPLNQLRCRLGLPEMRDFRHHYAAGDWCAYLDLPGWVPLPELPPGHFFLGPLVWQPRGLLSLPLGKLGQRRPLVYVSMGSSGAGGVLPNVLRSLLELNCDVALSGVSEQPALAPGRALPNTAGRLRAAPLFDPTEGLRRAALTVCHGGSGTIYQSLAAGGAGPQFAGQPRPGSGRRGRGRARRGPSARARASHPRAAKCRRVELANRRTIRSRRRAGG